MKKKAQSIFEYFILFGVCAVIIVLGSKAFKTDIREKLVEYRDHQGNLIISADENTQVSEVDPFSKVSTLQECFELCKSIHGYSPRDYLQCTKPKCTQYQ